MKEMLSVIRMDLLKLRSVAGAMFPLLIIVFFLSATLSVSAAVFLYVIVVYFFVYTPGRLRRAEQGGLPGPARCPCGGKSSSRRNTSMISRWSPGPAWAALAAGGIGAALKLGRAAR